MGRNLRKFELTALKLSLPHFRNLLDQDQVTLNKHYNQLAICVFDHWLRRDEMNILFSKDPEEIASRQQKNRAFIEGLFDLTTVWFWRYKRDRPFVFSPENKGEVLRKCKLNEASADRGDFYSLVLPEVGAVYSESFDWTNTLSYHTNEKIKPVLKLAEDCGLFKLEYKTS